MPVAEPDPGRPAGIPPASPPPPAGGGEGPGSGGTPALCATGLTFGYHAGEPVLRDVNVTFDAGLVTAILGPNGAGKSTLLRLLAGLLVPGRGSVCVADGREAHTLAPSELAGRVAYLAQRPSLSAPFSVRRYVALGLYASGADAGAVQGALERLDLRSLAERPFAELSVGQQHRAALARALAQLEGASSMNEAMGPHGQVLLADEPVAAFDPRHSLSALELMREQATRGRCVVVAMHEINLAARFADRVLVLDEAGRVAAHAPAHEALTDAVLERVFRTRFTRFGPVGDAPGGIGAGGEGLGRVGAVVPWEPAGS